MPFTKLVFFSEGVVPEAKKFGARINFVTLLDRAPDGDTRWSVLRVSIYDKPDYWLQIVDVNFLSLLLLYFFRKYLTIKQRCVGNVRWYACTFCHKEFKKPSDLIRHLRVHTQEKPFKVCARRRDFSSSSPTFTPACIFLVYLLSSFVRFEIYNDSTRTHAFECQTLRLRFLRQNIRVS